MGSGKSSLMDAISFAFFGTFPALESRRIKIQDLFRYDSNNILLKLCFEHDNKKYLIERTIEKKGKLNSADAKIYYQDKLMEKGSKAVGEYVSQLIGLDYSLFSRAVYSEQNNIDYFLTLNPKKRKEEFDALLGLDRFEMARANITTLTNRLKNRRADSQANFDLKKSEELKIELKNKTDKLENISKETGILKSEIKNKNDALKLVEGDIRVLELSEISLKQLKEKEIRANSIIENYNEDLKIPPKRSLEIIQNELEATSQKLKNENRSLTLKSKEFLEKSIFSGRMENELRKKEDLIKRIKIINEQGIKESSHYETELSRKEKSVIFLRSEIEKNKGQNIELSKLMEGLEKGSEKCPMCDSKIDKEHIQKINNEKNQKLKKNRELIFSMEKELGVIENEIKKLSDEKTKSEKLRSEKNHLEDEAKKISATKEQFEDIKKETYNLKSVIEEVKKNLENLRKIEAELGKEYEQTKNYNEKKKKLNTLKTVLLPKIKNQIKEINFDENKLRKSREAFNSIKLLAVQINEKIIYLEKEKKYIACEIETLKKSLNELNELEKKINGLISLEEELLFYKNVLSQVQINLRDSLIESINLAMNQIWGIFYPYRDYQKIRTVALENDYDFEFYNGEWKKIESIASGGERACFAITLRVALSTVLVPNIGWLIMDEPTHNLDRESINLLSETLQMKIPQIIAQCIVITHEELLAGANFSTTYKFERDKENKGHTVIERI